MAAILQTKEGIKSGNQSTGKAHRINSHYRVILDIRIKIDPRSLAQRITRQPAPAGAVEDARRGELQPAGRVHQHAGEAFGRVGAGRVVGLPERPVGAAAERVAAGVHRLHHAAQVVAGVIEGARAAAILALGFVEDFSCGVDAAGARDRVVRAPGVAGGGGQATGGLFGVDDSAAQAVVGKAAEVAVAESLDAGQAVFSIPGVDARAVLGAVAGGVEAPVHHGAGGIGVGDGGRPFQFDLALAVAFMEEGSIVGTRSVNRD